MKAAAAQAVVAVAALLAGCAVDQDAEVAQYRQVLDGTVARVPAYVPGEPLPLLRSLALANQGSEALAVRGEEYVQALIQRQRLADSFLPTVVLAPNYAVEDRPRGNLANTITGWRRVGDTAQRFEVPVNGSVEVFRGFGDVASLRAAEAIVGQRRELLLDLQASVLVGTASVYYQGLRAERTVEVLRTSLTLQTARLADSEGRLQNGLATRLQVAQTRAQVDATRATLVQAEGDVRNARAALAQLLAVPSVDGGLTDGYALPEARAELAACEAAALEHRQDLRAAQAAVVAAKEQVEAATAEYWPSVGLDLTGFLYREEYDDASRWSGLLSLHLPLFAAGRIRADVRTAWSHCREAALLESAARHQVLRDVRTAHSDLDTADRRRHELGDEVAAAAEAYAQAKAAFDHQLATNLEVLAAQDQLLTAQLELTAVEFDQKVAALQLLRAMGQLPELLAGKKP